LVLIYQNNHKTRQEAMALKKNIREFGGLVSEPIFAGWSGVDVGRVYWA
jgi:hypothetical protein